MNLIAVTIEKTAITCKASVDTLGAVGGNGETGTVEPERLASSSRFMWDSFSQRHKYLRLVDEYYLLQAGPNRWVPTTVRRRECPSL